MATKTGRFSAGKTYCQHETDPTPVRVVPPAPGFKHAIEWFRCKKCGQEFSERWPTIIFQPPVMGE